MRPENQEWGDANEKQDHKSQVKAPLLRDSLETEEPAYLFEFFSSDKLHYDMCPADDIIVSGKLLPLDDQSRYTQQADESPTDLVMKNVCCRRSESLSKLMSIEHSNSIKARAIRTSRSVDDRKHKRSHSCFVPELDRNCCGKSFTSSSKVQKSRWQLLMSGIGMVKVPVEMELRDIKTRQSRSSNPAFTFLGSDAKHQASSGRNGSTWGLIKALSCKDHTSLSVTTSFICMPHI